MRIGTFMALLIATALPAAEPPKSGTYWVFVGTYTGPKSKGIYRCEFDYASGKLGEPELAAEVASPSFLAVHPNRQFLYAVGETGAGATAGSVHAFALDAARGALTKLNTQPSGGAGPCHISLDPTSKIALVANYGGGSAAALPIQEDGSLAPPSSVVQHQGKSVNPQRQEAPHAHSINTDPRGAFAVVADLGLDQVLVYRLDPTSGKLSPNDPPAVSLAPGAGPRHFAFHPAKPFAYVINELDCTISALTYSDSGKFDVIQTISTLPGERQRGYSTAEVQVHPSGRFVYGSNRGHHSIVGFRVDPESGKLRLIGHQGEGIKTPRNFGIDPTGRWMIVGNQDGHSIIVYSIDSESGELKPTGEKAEMGAPVCIKFVAKD